MAWLMVHCNINACDAQNREARETMLAISCFPTDGLRRAPRHEGLRQPRHCEPSEAIQNATQNELDCFVASAPRNDEARFPPISPRHCERSKAIQSHEQGWIASSQVLLAMTNTAAC